ncbi:bud emergence protein 1, partial [Coemansia asiatica]
QQKDVWVARSSHSSASTVSDLVIIERQSSGNQVSRHTRGSSGSSSSSASNYDNRSPTPKSGNLSSAAAPTATAALQNPRSRALTASSSSTSSIAERSSFRQLRKSSQPSGGSLHYMASENFPRFHKDEVADISVPSFICKDGAYLFRVSLVFYTNDERNIYRTYEDFVSCRSELSEKFPAETSSLKLARFSMHNSSMLYLNDSIAERRRNELQAYVQGLIATPAVVVEGPTVQRLFGSRVEALPDRMSSPSRSLRRTPQSSIQGRSRHSPSLSTDSALESQLTPASASSADTVVETTPIDLKGFSSMRIGKSVDGKYRPLTEVPPMPAEPQMQESEQKRATQRLSHKPSTGTLGGNSMVKVKVRLGDDMVAMRLPSELTLSELKARIAHKLGSEESQRAQPSITQIAYFAPSGESEPLCDDQDWETALLATNYKPVLTIVQ